MAKYYEVQVTMHHEVDNGKGVSKVKKTKENYLVDAMSVTEAEARVVKLFTGSTFDFEVISVRGSKVLEVVSYETPKKEVATKKVDVSTIEDKDNEI